MTSPCARTKLVQKRLLSNVCLDPRPLLASVCKVATVATFWRDIP